MRIHISQETKECLDLLGGYHVECRGKMDVKVCDTLSSLLTITVTTILKIVSNYNKMLKTREECDLCL
jgi:hypothetical protein